MSLANQRIGHLRIDERLGRGGMGEVYLGFDEKLRRKVAVKTLHQAWRKRTDSRSRFIREARILSRLNHPAICQVYDLLSHGERDLLILEYIEGQTLRHLDKTELSFEDKLKIGIQVCEAITVAHREQVIHRDLKPENIMLTPEGKVKVLDFGLARSTDSLGFGTPPTPIEPMTGARGEAPWRDGDLEATEIAGPGQPQSTPLSDETHFVTQSRHTLGTLAYMSPEQARHRPITAATDLFSFGLVLQELFTGERAYPKAPMREMVDRAAGARTRPIEGLDSGLSEIIRSLLVHRAEDRPSAGDTLERLRHLAERPMRQRRQRRRVAVAALFVLALLAALGTWAGTRLQARRSAMVAQQFIHDADEIEWLLRSTYLNPPHDIRSAQHQVLDRIEALRQRMDELGSIGRGPGELTLGRASLALKQFANAREHLKAAWDVGYRKPEVALHLGLASFEVYRQELAEVQKIGDGDLRDKRLHSLRAGLKENSLRYLEMGREALLLAGGSNEEGGGQSSDSLDFVQALIAFYEDRFQEALAHLRSALAERPLFYEAMALEGKIHHTMAIDAEAAGRYEEALNILGTAEQAFARAAEVGRSDPEVHLGHCELFLEWLNLGRSMELADAKQTFDRGKATCELALVIDPESSTALRLLSSLHMRAAEVDSMGGNSELLDQAEALAKRSIALDPEDPVAWKSLGHVYSVLADQDLFRGRTESPAMASLIEAYSAAQRLAPNDPVVVNSMGNAYSMQAEFDLEAGRDPRPMARDSVAAYERAIALDENFSMPFPNVIITLWIQARYEMGRGLDPTATVAAAEGALDRLLLRNPTGMRGLSRIARIHEVAARHAILQGQDPRPQLRLLQERAERALEIYSDELYAHISLARGGLLRAEFEMDRGEDATASLLRAEDALDAVAEVETGPILTLRAKAHRLRAKEALAAGRSLSSDLQKATSFLDAALATEPDLDDAFLEKGRLALFRASALTAKKQDPFPAFTDAEDALSRAIELAPHLYESHLAQAHLYWRRAEAEAARGRDPKVAIAQARQRLATLQDLHPGLTEARAIDARLDLLAAPFASAAEAEALRQRGTKALQEALDSNANLETTYG